jgi:predicted ATPase
MKGILMAMSGDSQESHRRKITGGTMRIKNITLENWKNFRSVQVEVNDRLFIVGVNASGKSNFLDALRFMRDIVKHGGGLQYAVSQRGGISKIRCLSARERSYLKNLNFPFTLP